MPNKAVPEHKASAMQVILAGSLLRSTKHKVGSVVTARAMPYNRVTSSRAFDYILRIIAVQKVKTCHIVLVSVLSSSYLAPYPPAVGLLLVPSTPDVQFPKSPASASPPGYDADASTPRLLGVVEVVPQEHSREATAVTACPSTVEWYLPPCSSCSFQGAQHHSHHRLFRANCCCHCLCFFEMSH